MVEVKVKKLNESYSLITTDIQTRKNIIEYLKVEDPKSHFNKLVKLGIKDKYIYFTKFVNDDLLIYSGLRHALKNFGIQPIDESNNVTDTEINNFLSSLKFPFQPHDYQLNNIKLALTNNKMLFKACTGSGKSLTISVILEFFRQKNYKGILVVPNINLLTQFKSDIESYGFNDLNNQIQLLGNKHQSNFDTCLTITTWQSMQKEMPNLKKLNFDYIIVDECHRASADILRDIVLKSSDTKIKLGFTGTLPDDDPVALMTLLGLFGKPSTIITSKELIDRGLATPVKIKTIFLNYPYKDKTEFNSISRADSDTNYSKQLEFIKKYQPRQEIISNLLVKLKQSDQNTLALFQHTEHGKEIFTRVMNKLYPDITIDDSMIVGKDSFEFQKKYKVLFMNGEQSGTVRELQRNFLEQENGVILIANYSVASTGINIKNLHNLVFVSPLKSFTTISQSLGRLMRKHNNKKQSVIYDIVDDFGIRVHGGVFYKQYKHRLASSYIPEEFEVSDTVYNM